MLTHLGVRNHVKVPLAVALLAVREAGVLVWQRQQRLGKHGPVLDEERELALIRALHRPATANHVAAVRPPLEPLEGLVAQASLVQDELERPCLILAHGWVKKKAKEQPRLKEVQRCAGS